MQSLPSAQTVEAKSRDQDVDWKLCLVLQGSSANELVRDVEGVLTVPQLGCKAGGHRNEDVMTMKRTSSISLTRRKIVELRFQALSPWVCFIKNRCVTFLVSALFLTLILLDGMVNALVGYTLRNLCGRQALWLWLLLPTPLAPALSLAIGIASLMLHEPSRLYSQLAWRSSFNTLLVGLPAFLQADVPLLNLNKRGWKCQGVQTCKTCGLTQPR